MGHRPSISPRRTSCSRKAPASCLLKVLQGYGFGLGARKRPVKQGIVLILHGPVNVNEVVAPEREKVRDAARILTHQGLPTQVDLAVRSRPAEMQLDHAIQRELAQVVVRLIAQHIGRHPGVGQVQEHVTVGVADDLGDELWLADVHVGQIGEEWYVLQKQRKRKALSKLGCCTKCDATAFCRVRRKTIH